ncbi:MAG: dTDP-4-dehydrorhamnose reductase [Actinomycetes bacterium]
MTRWLVTGAGGMLGRDLMAVLEEDPSAKVTAATRAELDVTDEAAVRDAVGGHDVVVNAAAWTDVDAAETHEPEATRVNGEGPRVLALACAATGARLLHVSTDYVFDGTSGSPYAEDAAVAPRSAYGRGKAAGERAVLDLLPDSGFVVRTGWLYGEYGRSFVSTMLRLERERDTLDVVDDQYGQPTWAYDLAHRLVVLNHAAANGRAPAGVYHGTCSGATTWCRLARAVFTEIGADPARVRATTTDRFPRPAPRPAWSVLGHARWAAVRLAPMPGWRTSLHRAMPALTRVVPSR